MSKQYRRERSGQLIHGILGHWLWALPILLVLAALALRQIDIYPATYDELYSMMNSGWVIDKPFSPVDVLESIAQYSPNHTPLYFLLLNLWGHLLGYELAMGRVFTVFTALLALSAIYRLSRDFVAPIAGLFALVAVASNTFYNYFYAHVRMYPLLALTSALCFWLYLRILQGPSDAKRTDYFAFFAVTLALLYTHVFSALFLLALGAYHALIAAKGIRWLKLAAAGAAALALFSPWLIVLIGRGLGQTLDNWIPGLATVREVLSAWLYVGFNGSRELAALVVLAVLVGMRTKSIRAYHLFIVFFILALAFIAQVTGMIRVNSMRLALSSLPPLALFVAAGLYALYRLRTWLGLFALFWILAGFSFQNNAALANYLGARVRNFNLPAWHAVSRLALESGQSTRMMGYSFPVVDLYKMAFRGRSQAEIYFNDHGIEIGHAVDRRDYKEYSQQISVTAPKLWTFYRAGLVSADDVAGAKSIMRGLSYDLCAVDEVGFDTVILQYSWSLLECAAPDTRLRHQNALLEYEIYEMETSEDEMALSFVDHWAPRQDFAIENYRLSHQIINENRERVAQLDSPLVQEGELRRFSIDLHDVPPGAYRLMVIVYDARTGERQAWIDNPGQVAEMLQAGEFTLE